MIIKKQGGGNCGPQMAHPLRPFALIALRYRSFDEQLSKPDAPGTRWPLGLHQSTSADSHRPELRASLSVVCRDYEDAPAPAPAAMVFGCAPIGALVRAIW